ncbi:uncharacterized protein BXZ73DRAFT_6663, partial [Epithele typhae]|uniref:uncharacterized protein n=1 Tax=Epithele typhae TaxID=378194 RepID=UPI0020082D01
LLAVACDSASANNVMVERMDDRLPKFRASTGHVHCFGHVIQLVGFGMLKQFEPVRKKKTAEGESED